MALAEIERAQANLAERSGKPLAIVLDCDETITDNTRARRGCGIGKQAL